MTGVSRYFFIVVVNASTGVILGSCVVKIMVVVAKVTAMKVVDFFVVITTFG